MNVAMCIPTYNRADVVAETLSKGIEGYAKMGIDLYYYDSSPDDKTKNVIEEYINKGYKNIKYISVRNGESKAALFFTGEGLDRQYDYVWPVKDRVWFEEPTLIAVEKAINEGWDAIFLGVLWCFSHPNIGTKVYDSPKEFYLDWGYLVTSLDVNIFKCESMLQGLTYEQVKEYNASFIHFQLMFHQLANGEKKVKALVGKDIVAYNSQLVSSGWKERAFLTWKERWISVNEELPECYEEHKKTVIKQAGTLPWIFGSVDSLIEFREYGALVPENLDSILEDWDKVSDISKEKVIAIANGTYDKGHDLELLQKQQDELLNLFVKMADYIKSGKMKKEQIPYNDVFRGIMNRVVKRCNGDTAIANLVAGSVDDLIMYIRNEAKTTEQINKAFQMLIIILKLSV